MTVIHTTFIITITHTYINLKYTNALLNQIISKTITQEMPHEEKVLALLNITHNLLEDRQKIFVGRKTDLLTKLIPTTTCEHLQEGLGACGSHAQVLGRLLQNAGYKIRIAQMVCKESYARGACHILVEVKLNNSWVILDPSYTLFFKKENGTLASFNEVKKNWMYYKKQLPKIYPEHYTFEEIRYSNWNKIPVVMPTIKSVLFKTIGDKVNQICIRAYFLSILKAQLISLIICYSIFILLTVNLKSKNNLKKPITQ